MNNEDGVYALWKLSSNPKQILYHSFTLAHNNDKKPIQLNKTAVGRQHVLNGHFSNCWKLLSSTKQSYLSWVREIFSGCWFREQWKKHQLLLLCNLWAFLCGELSGNQALASSMIRMSKMRVKGWERTWKCEWEWVTLGSCENHSRRGTSLWELWHSTEHINWNVLIGKWKFGEQRCT